MTLDYFYGQAGELFSFFRIPKALFQEQRFQDLSTDAKTLYGILLDRMSLSVKNEWFDKKGRVFIIFTIEDVKRTLRCADNKATRLLRELEEFGLIERKRRGQGKPCLVYVKNFSAESSKESVKNRDNDDSCGSKIACQDPVKSRGIKKKENKTEMNNTNPILSDESEKMKNRELLEEYFSYSLEIDLLLRLYPDDEDKFCALMLSVALCAGMAAPAFAYGGEPVEEVEQPVLTAATEKEEAITVTDAEAGALTPEGNLTLVDDYHTDYSDGSGQQFITLVSKSGNTFYLVIDRNAKGQQTVHFMNLVDEADLLALMEEEDADAYTAEKEAAVQAEQDRLKAEEEAKKAAEEAAASGSEQTGGNKVTKYAATFLGVLALVGLAAGGSIYAFMKQKQKKQAEKEALDPDANYTEDKGDFEIPTDALDEDEVPVEPDTEPI